jgi:hypothetical protein
MPKINCCAECVYVAGDSSYCYSNQSYYKPFQYNKCPRTFHLFEGLKIYHLRSCKGICDHSIICNNFKRRKLNDL